MFKRWKQKHYNEGFSAGLIQARQEIEAKQSDSQNRRRYEEVARYIDKPVIMIGNEWSDPIIGFGVRVSYVSRAQCPMLVVQDYISNQEYLAFGVLMDFTTQKFDAILKLNPLERFALLANNAVGDSIHKRDFRPHTLNHVEIQARLIGNGFFAKLPRKAKDI